MNPTNYHVFSSGKGENFRFKIGEIGRQRNWCYNDPRFHFIFHRPTTGMLSSINALQVSSNQQHWLFENIKMWLILKSAENRRRYEFEMWCFRFMWCESAVCKTTNIKIELVWLLDVFSKTLSNPNALITKSHRLFSWVDLILWLQWFFEKCVLYAFSGRWVRLFPFAHTDSSP